MNFPHFRNLKCLAVVSALLVNLTALALPDLTPYQPAGWSDKIVVSTGTGSNIDSFPLAPTDTLYVDWAVINQGDASAGACTISLYVDGVLKVNFGSGGIPASSYSYAVDYNIGSLSAGSHTVSITADSGNVVTESNEANNTYVKNITVGASSLPNLTPYQPAGWSDKIVVTTNTGTSTDSPVLEYTNTLYVDWAITNSGGSTASNFVVTLSVDGAVSNYWVITALAAGTYTNFVDYSIGSLAGGGHTVTITCDASNNVTEANEGDNAYTKNISVLSPSLPNLVPYTKSGWSDPVVVSTTAGVFTSNHSPTTTNTLYVDWAVINSGVSSAAASTTTLYIDGVVAQTWGLGSLPVNSYSYVTDYSIGQLSAGTHKISIMADSASVVPESNETDNAFTNTITVTAIIASAPTLTAPANGSAAQATAPAFSWSAVTGVTGYRIIVATNAADLPTDVYATNGGPSTVISATTTNNFYTPVPINPGVTYYWQVHGRYGTSDAGTWSSVFSFTTAVTMSGLVIVPTFDSSITSDPQAITLENTINAAIAVYEANFTNPVTVSITFKKMGSGLGQSSFSTGSYSYSSYRAALVSHSASTDDTTAVAFLPNTSGNPATGDANMSLQYPLARALGLTSTVGSPDGTISLNLSLCNYSAVNADPTKYALFSVVSHEIDEVLGMGSALNGLANGAPSPTGAASPMDLFRYDGAGARSLSTVSNLASYFSLDGTTQLARFNQYAGGDYQDFYSYYGGQTPEVQDAFATQGSSPVLGVELRVLDAIGYTRAVAFLAKTNQTITFNPLPAKALGEPAFVVAATASSGLPVSFSIVSGPATISTATITMTNTGTVTVQAAQAGNTNYNAAPSTNQSFVVYARPGIGFGKSGTNFVLSWYTNVAGFGLYSTTNLTTNSWQAVTPAPVIVNGQYVVSNGISGPTKFYRLMK